MRRVVFGLAAAVVLLVVVLVWKHDGDAPDHARRTSTTAAAARSTPNASIAPSLPGESRAAEPAQPQPVPVDPANAPSLDAPHSKPAPPQKPFDRDETISKRAADLKLLDDTRARLEKELAAAQAAGNATAVHDLQMRITRTTALRKQRSSELDQLRAGGTVPP